MVGAQRLLVERFADNPFAIRYTVTHDLHHLLTGFDTGVAGEMGVLAFSVGQGAAPVGPLGAALYGWLGPIMSPSQAAAIRHNYELGKRMGKRAKLVVAAPLESWLAEPLTAVRERLGIAASDIADERPSGRSWLAKLAYRRRVPGHRKSVVAPTY